MKRVLVISYYWPPAGGISVLRSLKIVKYLRQYGWEPVVFIPENANYPVYDKNGFKDIPDKLEVISTKITEPFGLFKWLTGRKKEDSLNSIVQVRTKKSNLLDVFGIWLRGNFFIPDARSLWIRPAVSYLSKYLKNNPVDAIFSDGPPHTNNRIAYNIAKKHGIPWLADFQDPWTQADYYQMMLITKWAHRIHSKMEQQVFAQAQKITIASPSWKKDLESIGAKHVDVIYYGYDEDDFKPLQKQKNSSFTVVHIGLLGIDRYPEGLMAILAEVATDKKIELILAGQVDYEVQKNLTVYNDIKVDVSYPGFISRRKALQLAMNADLLLLPLNKAENAHGRLPGKLYEYLRTYNPILALGEKEGDAAKIIRDCHSGDCFEYNERALIKSFVQNIYIGKRQHNPLKNKISAFSNEEQTRLVAKYLDNISA